MKIYFMRRGILQTLIHQESGFKPRNGNYEACSTVIFFFLIRWVFSCRIYVYGSYLSRLSYN